MFLVKTIVIFTALFGVVGEVSAKEYFGFSLGSQTKEEVLSALNKAGAKIDSVRDQGFGLITAISVDSYERFNKFGELRFAGFRIGKNKLFRMFMTYNYDGAAFNSLKGALRDKYGNPDVYEDPQQLGVGEFTFHDGQTTIKLGIDGSRSYTLLYVFDPIDNDIDMEIEMISKQREAKERADKAMRAPADL